MKIHEYQAMGLFAKAGLPVCLGEVAATLVEAQQIVQKTGFPVVLKSQVLIGGRGKAGGIKVVKNDQELAAMFPQLRQLTIKGYPVELVYIVQAITIKKEFYLAMTVDSAKDDVVVIASSAGGVDIEETAKKNAQAIHKFYLQGARQLDAQRWGEFVKAAFPDNAAQQAVTGIARKLTALFFEHDCSLAEINPLVIDDKGQWWAVDAKVTFDDNALFRHPDIMPLRDMKYEDADEIEAKQVGLSFVKMDGNVGCIVNGAGLAMATLDVIKLLGGEPANFLDVGGSSNPEKVLNALKIILRNQKVKSILINIFGGITRCDDIANGILAAREQLKFTVPIVVRLTGTNEDLAKQILAKAGINTYATMREVVTKAVALAK